jgi:hypothetical protein
MANPTAPDLEWYKSVSAKHGGPPRCPFAHVRRCPRYFYSLSLLGEYGSTKIPPAEDEALMKFWTRSDAAPITLEQEPGVSSSGDRMLGISNFCPEVTYDRFGWFASYLHRYADEIDLDLAHEQLGKMHAPADDPRWAWSSTMPMHYTDCPQYSLLLRVHPASTETASADWPVPNDDQPSKPWRRAIAFCEGHPVVVAGIVIPVLLAIATMVLSAF